MQKEKDFSTLLEYLPEDQVLVVRNFIFQVIELISSRDEISALQVVENNDSLR